MKKKFTRKLMWLALFAGLLITMQNVYAQQLVTGTVLSETSEGMPGVNVVVKGTTTGTTTDSDGRFSIQVQGSNAVLVFSFVGYAPMEFLVGSQTQVSISMTPDIGSLQEVVVIGYGTQTKEQITTAVASVKEKDFTTGAMRDASELIKGKVAGLTITNGTGDPSAGPAISLRGVSTLKGNTAPLILVDGIPGSFNTVSPQDIISVDVLKDASAAAIYGTRGANGVIIITTRQGANKAPTLTYSYYSAFSSMARKADFMTAEDYANSDYDFKQDFVEEANDHGGVTSTDWLDEITQQGYMQSHNLSLTGGNAKSNYAANVNYIDQSGVFKKSDNKEFRASLNMNQYLFNDKVKLNFNMFRSMQEVGALGNGTSFNPLIYRNALIRNPMLAVKDEDGNLIESTARLQYINPVGMIEEADGLITINLTRLTSNITVDLMPGLESNLMLATEIRNGFQGYYETKENYNSLNGPNPYDTKPTNGYASRGDNQNQTNYLEFTTRYSKTFGSHDFSLLGGYSYQYNINQGGGESNMDFPTNAYSYNNLGAGVGIQDGRATVSSYMNDNLLIGFFGRLTYSLNDKINVLASVRQEGSSKFGENNKWGTFPAVSAGWIISKESFLESVEQISLLKLRAGYGVTGVIPGESYKSIPQLSYNGPAFYYNGAWVNGLIASGNPNPDLRWEKSQEINVGLDFGVLADRLTGSVDFYVKKTSDMLWDYTVPIPPNLYPTTLANVGEMENKGIELLLQGSPIEGKNFQWNIIGTFSANKNELTSLSNDLYQIEGDYIPLYGIGEPISMQSHRLEVGKSVSTLWGLKSVDITDDGKWVVEYPDGTTAVLENNQPGNDDAHNQVLGNGIPKYRLGLTNTFRYKNFDLSVVMNGAFGFQIWNQQRMFYENPNITYNVLKSSLDDIYGKRPLGTTLQSAVSYYVEDGDYLKIDNVTLGYNLNLSKVKFIRSARIYASASNLAFITGYKGIDPELPVPNMQNGTLMQGLDNRDKFPTVRTYTIGVNLNF